MHGPVFAQSLTVGGPVTTTLPKGEPPGSAGQAYATSLLIGGPLTVQGPLIVEGSLKVGGPLLCEPQTVSIDVPRQNQGAPRQEWTE